MELETELEDGKYDVEEIVDHRIKIKKDGLEYRARLKGYASDEECHGVTTEEDTSR